MRLLSIPLALLLNACSDGPTKPTPPQVNGWRTASAEASNEGLGDDFWGRLVVAGNRLLAMRGNGEIWRSDSYSSGWTKMNWTWLGTPTSWFADGDSVWIGTQEPGRFYGCKVSNWACTDLKLPDPDTFGVSHVGRKGSQFIVVSGGDGVRSVWQYGKAGWLDWSQGFPLDEIYRTLEYGDTLWAATWRNGLWYRVGSENTWKRQAAPRETWMTSRSDSAIRPRGIAWYHGALWTGDQSGELTRIPNGKAPYQASRNCRPTIDGPGACRDQPLYAYSLLAYGEKLFVGGFFGGNPQVLDEATGFWLPTEAAGWCWNDGKTCGGLTTWDMVGLGDTVYTASRRFIMKIALKDVTTFAPWMMDRYGWPRDTSWRDSVLRRNNPLGM